MELGLTMFVTDRSIGVVELAREAEARGFESLFLPEHTHIPVSRRTPYPAGGELPEEYRRTLDPFVALTAAATATDQLRVGTGVCLVAQRDPVVLAKEVASLDAVSGGRFVFGIGVGWNVDEMEHHGVEPKRRRAIVREKVLAMQRLWSDEEAAFNGDHVRLEPSWAWPKPVQQPRPPILYGGAASATLFAHIAEYADGWMPIGGAGVAKQMPELRAAFEAAGRDPDTARLTVFFAAPDPGKLEYYRSLGVERTVLGMPSADRDTILPALDRYAKLVS